MMASSTVPSCSVCCCLPLQKSSDRRKLHSPATSPVFSVLGQMTTEVFPGCVETVFESDAYLCKPCVRAVEKLIKTRESVQKQEKELREKIICAGRAKGLCHLEGSAEVCFNPRTGHCRFHHNHLGSTVYSNKTGLWCWDSNKIGSWGRDSITKTETDCSRHTCPKKSWREWHLSIHQLCL